MQTNFYDSQCISYVVKILNIDDIPEISDIFSDILKTKNNDFESTTDGKKDLDLVLKNYYDLILLDMCMSNYGGIDFLLDLKDKKSPKIRKVIVVISLELDAHQTRFSKNSVFIQYDKNLFLFKVFYHK